MAVDRVLISALTQRLEAEGNADRAAGQQRYMKSALPYFGVTLPRTVAITREVAGEYLLDSYADWRDTILALFREATHRELWYAAEELAEHSSYRAFARQRESLGLYEKLIVEGAWWDIVDRVSAHLVGGLFESDPLWTAERMHEWTTDSHLWKRRAAIICQIRRGSNVNLALLQDSIAPNLNDTDFFIRKAIGWALREASKTHPDEVIQYVQEHRNTLSGLSKREAMRRLLRSGAVESVP